MNLEFEENITRRGAKKRARTVNAAEIVQNPTTPSKILEFEPKTPITFEQTPRRSARKSIKPAQDYDDIIARTMRSTPIKNAISDVEERKWTPAKVGRVSQKRSTRKNARKSEKLKNIVEINTEHTNFQMDEEDDGILNTTFDKSEGEFRAESESKAQNDLNELGLTPIIYDGDDICVDTPVEAMSTKCMETENQCYQSSCQETGFNIENKDPFEKTENFSPNQSAVTGLKINRSPVNALIHADAAEKVFEQLESNTLQTTTQLQKEMPCDEDQDMPSLILCDDEDEENIKNNTFNASDCVILSPSGENNAKLSTTQLTHTSEINHDSPLVKAGKKVKEIQTKYFNANMTQNQVLPKIVVSFVDIAKPTSSKLSQIPRSSSKTAQGSPGSVSKRNVGGGETPRQSTEKRGYKFPTPFKTKMNLNFTKTDKENTLISPKGKLTVLTTLEPREIVLRSMRKRSLSTTDCDEHKRKNLNVTFYSPANQTATTEDLDQLMAEKANKSDKKNQNTKIARTRSISLDDNALCFPSKLPRPVKMPTKSLKSPLKPTARTKLPNFAAIHEKQFQKMENLVDYVARKAERAQNLTNSALKAQNGILSKPSRNTKPEFAGALSFTASNTKDNSDKLSKRRERHMAMFKGRDDRTNERKLKNKEIIKGVRSNRHFELLMQHRKISGK